MTKRNRESNKKLELLKCLLGDPTRSVSKTAETIGTYQRMVWQKKKELEDDHVIWGYTTVIDESKLDHVLYEALFKIKPLSIAFADLIIGRLLSEAPMKEGIRLIDVFYTTGDYACIIRFSAPDNAAAKMYYETLRIVYKDHFLEEPLLLEVNFPLVKMGKLNPELKKIYDLVPKVIAE